MKLIKCQLFGNGDCDVMTSVASVTCCVIVPDTKYVLKKETAKCGFSRAEGQRESV